MVENKFADAVVLAASAFNYRFFVFGCFRFFCAFSESIIITKIILK